MNSLDAMYAELIQWLISIIGHEVAYQALMTEANHRLDATSRHALDMEGAFANETVQILKDYPEWDI